VCATHENARDLHSRYPRRRRGLLKSRGQEASCHEGGSRPQRSAVALCGDRAPATENTMERRRPRITTAPIRPLYESGPAPSVHLEKTRNSQSPQPQSLFRSVRSSTKLVPIVAQSQRLELGCASLPMTPRCPYLFPPPPTRRAPLSAFRAPPGISELQEGSEESQLRLRRSERAAAVMT
jgi:hypothetical protein